MKIRTILDRIDLGSMALPESRRGYVRDRDQVRGLMQSLDRKHPVGSLLVWEARTENARARGDGRAAGGPGPGGRGREPGCPGPPAQNRTSGTTAYGSYFGCLA